MHMYMQIDTHIYTCTYAPTHMHAHTHTHTHTHTRTHTHLISREGHKQFIQHSILHVLIQLLLIQVVMCFISASKE